MIDQNQMCRISCFAMSKSLVHELVQIRVKRLSQIMHLYFYFIFFIGQMLIRTITLRHRQWNSNYFVPLHL